MDEANRMITDSAVRLGNAAEDLRVLVVRPSYLDGEKID